MRHSMTAVCVISIAILFSCASGGPRPTRNLAEKDKAQRLVERALSLARNGAARKAVDEIRAALAKANAASSDALLQAEAWTYLLGGDLENARAALAEARGAPGSTAPSRVLIFRLEQFADRALARSYAEASRADPSSAALDTTALEVMAGDRDFRDVPIRGPEDAASFATYLSGYRVDPEPAPGSAAPAPSPATLDGAPIVVVEEPESVDADASAVAVARLAYRDGLAKSGAFRVVDAQTRKDAVEEVELSLSGSVAAERDRAVGGLFAADYVASGSVVRSDPGWLVAFTLSSAADGRIVASEFIAAPDNAAIADAASRFTVSLGDLARKGALPVIASR